MKKKQNVNILIDKIIELYNLYERTIWNNNNYTINIYCNNNPNTKNSFIIINYLENNIVIDSFELNFNKFEYNLYKYISSKIMVEIFKNIELHINNNKFYNKVHKPYLKLIINDESLLEELRGLSILLNNYQYDEINDILNTKNNKLSKKEKMIDEDIVITTHNRINISKKLIRK